MNTRTNGESVMSEIPLEDAMILWNSAPPKGDGRIKVVWHMREDDSGFSKSSGACFASWMEGTREDREHYLLHTIWDIAVNFGIPVTRIHEAMLVIPEYRDMIVTSVYL